MKTGKERAEEFAKTWDLTREEINHLAEVIDEAMSDARIEERAEIVASNMHNFRSSLL